MYKHDLDKYKKLRLLESKTDLLFYAVEIFSTQLRIAERISVAQQLPVRTSVFGSKFNKIGGYPCGSISITLLI